jgi:ABC-type Fe3+/spermidine/putrescine transport system ATPase subunit
VRERLRDELIAMQQEFGFTGIYVTHDQTEAAALASRIAVFGHGQIEQLGIPQHVFNAPGSGYVADFVGFTNELAGVVCGCGQQQAQVDTAVGRLFATSSDGQLRDGQRVRVMFRPEHVEVTRLAGNGVNRLRAVVERSMFLGAHVEHRLNVGGQRMSQRAPGSEPLMAGDQVDIILNPDSIRAYAAD